MTVLIIDTSYLIYRSYFAYPNLTSNGLPTGAFFGFSKAILNLVQEYNPQELIFTNDTAKPTWRHEVLVDYKAGRPEIEQAMIQQIPIIKDWTAKVSKNFFSQDGFEADDFIFTAANEILKLEPNSEILIFSSDKDLYQLLIYPQVKFIRTKKASSETELFGREEFRLKHELEPEQWLDYKTLVGDNSDNLKGLSGVGPKTAVKILQEIGFLKELFEALGLESKGFSSKPELAKSADVVAKFLENPKNMTLIEKIKDNQELLRQTYHLATLQNVPETRVDLGGFNLTLGISDFEKFNFKSLATIVQKISAEQLNKQESLF